MLVASCDSELADEPEAKAHRWSENLFFGGRGIHERRNSSRQFVTGD
jgi:hypothetical protein